MFIKSYFIIGKVYSQGIPGVTTMLKTKLIETGVQDQRPRETRQAQKAPRVDRPRKASARSGNQR
ncbi:hypothetical protein RCO48_25855 [Peribacillus frigoritolerans]|nr:hypothetical protein [Peribacillus frigoritolerans]